MPDPTYAEVGATGGEPLPTGYHHLRVARVLGRGDEVFERAVERLFTWQAQERSWVRRVAGPDRVELGADVTFRFVGLLTIPCRVVAVVDETDLRGFAYATLPGHPETGEERFTVERAPDGTVTGHVVAFSRPVSPLLRLAGPFGRVGQRVMATRYLRALATP